MRLIRETPCEHGRIGIHWEPDPSRGGIRSAKCPGGSRTEVNPNIDAAYRVADNILVVRGRRGDRLWLAHHDVAAIVTAALTPGDPECDHETGWVETSAGTPVCVRCNKENPTPRLRMDTTPTPDWEMDTDEDTPEDTE